MIESCSPNLLFSLIQQEGMVDFRRMTSATNITIYLSLKHLKEIQRIVRVFRTNKIVAKGWVRKKDVKNLNNENKIQVCSKIFFYSF